MNKYDIEVLIIVNATGILFDSGTIHKSAFYGDIYF